jgi:hypothetical protein
MRLHRFLLVGNTRGLILSLVATAILSLLPLSSHATVDWNDGFEYTSNTALKSVWFSSCTATQHTGIMETSTARVHSGSRSLKLTYIGQNPPQTCFMDRYYPVTGTIYSRLYVFLDGFRAVDAGSKMFFYGENKYPNFWTYFFGSTNTFTMNLQGAVLTGPSANLKSGTIPTGRWVCIEQRITMNTPGVANGIYQSWVDGVQRHNHTNLLMQNASANTKMKFTRLYRQHGFGAIYLDDYAVSRNARIGCSGSTPSSDTTAPETPTGIGVQ